MRVTEERERENNAVNNGHYVRTEALLQRIRAAHANARTKRCLILIGQSVQYTLDNVYKIENSAFKMVGGFGPPLWYRFKNGKILIHQTLVMSLNS